MSKETFIDKKIKKEKYYNWKKSANIANKYGKDGWVSTLKNAIDILLIQEKELLNQELLEKMTELRDLRKEEKGKSLDYWEGYTKARTEDINQLLK